MTHRRILVPLAGIESERKALDLAFQAARRLGSHLDVLYVRADPNEALPYLGEGLTGGLVEEILDTAKLRGEACAGIARDAFARAAGEAGAAIVGAPEPGGRLTARLIEETGRVGEIVARAACLADLVVCSDAIVEPSAFEAALIDAGRPVLIAPKGDLPQGFAERVFIAWRESAEAGHAVSAALPFLKRAGSILIGAARRNPNEEDRIVPLTDYIGLHGLRAETRVFDMPGKSIASALIEAVTKEGCDFLVMGGYGHSRLREFILGGVTREIAGAAPVPVLMAH